jgi:uncharacterized membrane protein HdeD (DUF308 family)
MGLLACAVSATIGVLLLAWPHRTLQVLATLLGIYLLLLGIMRVLLALVEAPQERTARLLQGTVAGIAGLIVIRHPGGSVTLVALAIGIFLVLAGAIDLFAARAAVGGRGWLLAGGALDLVVGILMVAWPRFGIASLALLLGVALFVRAALELASALALRTAEHAFERAERLGEEPSGAPEEPSGAPSGFTVT